MNAAKIVRIVAVAAAVVAAFVTIPYTALILAVLGLISGFIGIEEERRQAFFIMVIALSVVAGSLGSIPVAGDYLTAILTNFAAVINAGAVAVILTIVYERVTE